MTITLVPQGPFRLANASAYFGGWPAFPPDPSAVAMTFPVESWRTSAAVILRQGDTGRLTGKVHGAAPGLDAAWAGCHARAALPLDADGRGFAEVGRRDPVIGRLQEQYGMRRPVCFHTPYEAAAHFVISQRIAIQQARTIRAALARALGD